MKILVVAAHPDDEVLGCGGTMARLAKEGHDVYASILGEGITSRHHSREETDQKALETLKDQCKRASGILGTKEVFFHDQPDNRFDTVSILKIIKIVEALVKRLEPSVIYTHHGGDLNIDHGVTSRAVLTATRPLAGCPVREIYTFEIPSSTEWSFGQFYPAFEPNTFVDIQKTMAQKIAALEVYENEIREFPHPRSTEALEAMARKWGAASGLGLAEAFYLVRGLK